MQKRLSLIIAVLLGVSICSCDDTGQVLSEVRDVSNQSLSETRTDEVSNSTQSQNVTSNTMDTQTANETKNTTFKVACLMNNTEFVPVVEIVNSTKLVLLIQAEQNITSLQTPAACVVVLFYSPACPFSCLAAPHFNALARVFPDIRMAAVDTGTRSNTNAQFGVVGLPSLLLFHNGRPASRFNSSSEFTLEEFAKFITNNTGKDYTYYILDLGEKATYWPPTQIWQESIDHLFTGLQPEGKLYVTSVDFKGPISSVPIKQTDYLLVLSWVFILLCNIYFFYYSSWCLKLVDAVKSAWREAGEAQHQHLD